MLRATLYIMACSGRNRLRRRLRRLKEPRYLLGALVGSAYLYFSIFARGRRRGAASRQGVRTIPLAFLPLLGGDGPVWAGLLMLAAAVVSLVMPFGSGLLDFTKAESEFLFPAPVSRRQLLLYRLMRSQWAVFFSALIIALAYPLAGPGARLRGFAGAWLALMTAHVFFTGVGLTRQRPASPTLTARLVAVGPRVALVAAAAIVASAAGGLAASRTLGSAGEVVRLLADTGGTGLPALVLWPFVAMSRPLFAPSFAAFLWSLPGAVLVYAATIAWVLSADQAFDSMTDAIAEGPAGKPARRTVTYRARPTAWTLALGGRPETLFVWKTATQTFRVVSLRLLIRAAVIIAWLTVLAMLLGDGGRGIAQVLGIFAAAAAAFAVLIGPQMVRLDLRQDLQHLELLKTWPVRAAAVVRGQMLWPALVVTAAAWLFGLVAISLSATAFSSTGVPVLAVGWAAMILVPALVFAQYTIHNAAALLFPAWIATGGSRPRGVDAMGQRLIMLTGTWLVLVVAILPGVLIGGILWLAFYRFVGPWILIPGAAIGTVIVTLEVLMATEALGPAFDRLDITSVERSDT